MGEPEVQPPKQRTPTGLLIRPRQQFRYAFVLMAGGIVAQSLAIAIVGFFLNRVLAGVISVQTLDPAAADAIRHAINYSLTVLIVFAIAFGNVAVLIGIKLSHRIYGPMIPFLRHIEKLKAGDYKARIRLRRTDDLGELRDALNNLTETLEAKYPKP